MPISIGSNDCRFSVDLLPVPVQNYLIHTQSGLSIRALARQRNTHASTIQRQVRRIEAKRDDPLIDAALDACAQILNNKNSAISQGAARMTMLAVDIDKEARRVLRRMCETGAVLAINAGLEKAVVLRVTDNAAPVRTAVVDQDVAQVFALKDWIAIKHKGKVTTYEITHAGRAALKRLVTDEKSNRELATGFAEAATPFADQHRDLGVRKIPDCEGRVQPVRFNLAESPLAVLARRKEKDGSYFLSPEMVDAGERLREDFELAQMGPRVGQNWDRFLTGGGGGFHPDSGVAEGPVAARKRVTEAVDALGPGLRDIVLRICCFLEGFEAAEKRMGWSARSGKIVLRIALTQLQRHYELQRRN